MSMATWEKNRDFRFQTNLKPRHASERRAASSTCQKVYPARCKEKGFPRKKKKKDSHSNHGRMQGVSPTPFRVFNVESGGRTWIRQNTATAAYSVKPCMATKKRNEEEKNGIQKAGSNAWTKNAKSVRCRPSRCHHRGSRGRIRGSVPPRGDPSSG